MMKARAALLALALAAPLPLAAQEASPADPSTTEEEGPSLMERGISLFFEGFSQELEPTLDDMANALEQFGPAVAPALERLMAMVDDMTNYELPEMLENGDIIIRRKPDAPAVEPQAEEDVAL